MHLHSFYALDKTNRARIFVRSKLSPEITGERFDLHSRKNTTFSMRWRHLKKRYIIPVKRNHDKASLKITSYLTLDVLFYRKWLIKRGTLFKLGNWDWHHDSGGVCVCIVSIILIDELEEFFQIIHIFKKKQNFNYLKYNFVVFPVTVIS